MILIHSYKLNSIPLINNADQVSIIRKDTMALDCYTDIIIHNKWAIVFIMFMTEYDKLFTYLRYKQIFFIINNTDRALFGNLKIAERGRVELKGSIMLFLPVEGDLWSCNSGQLILIA